MSVDPFSRARSFVARRDSIVAQLMRFGLLTGLSAMISVGLPVMLREGMGLDPRASVAIGFVTVFLVNLFAIRRFVFKSGGSLRQDIAKYGSSSLVFRGGEYVAFLVLFDFFAVNYVVALLVVLAASAVTKFFWYRRIMHRPERAEPIVG